MIIYIANNTVTYSHPLFFNLIWWHRPCIWLGTTHRIHPCNPSHYGLWVNLHFFTMCIYKHCFLPMFLLWNVVLKCLALCLITMIAARFPRLYACLACSSVQTTTCLISSPIACPQSSELCWMSIVFCFLYFCYMLHFFVTSFWLVGVKINMFGIA